jgi:hypothetical protein
MNPRCNGATAIAGLGQVSFFISIEDGAESAADQHRTLSEAAAAARAPAF